MNIYVFILKIPNIKHKLINCNIPKQEGRLPLDIDLDCYSYVVCPK